MTVYMRGSEGNFDYAVVAKKGDVRLGIKPIITDMGHNEYGQQQGVFIGLRIRSAAVDGSTVPAEVLVSSWPLIKFTNSDDKRASTSLGQVVQNHLIVNIEELFYRDIERPLTNSLASAFVFDPSQSHMLRPALRATIREQFKPTLEKFNTLMVHRAFADRQHCPYIN